MSGHQAWHQFLRSKSHPKMAGENLHKQAQTKVNATKSMQGGLELN